MTKMKLIAAAFLALIVLSTAAVAQGVLGNVVNWVLPGFGTVADDIHGRLKEAIPIYGKTEEATSALARRVGGEIGTAAGGPVLAQWIRASRDHVNSVGVLPMPTSIRSAFLEVYSAEFLDGIRYRVGSGNDIAVPANAFRGGAVAVVLDTVIVFRNSEAVHSVPLWAHELHHVKQYNNWGIDEFAKRYVRNHQDVEAEADAAAERYLNSLPLTSSGRWSVGIGRCVGKGGIRDVNFWGPQAESCNGIASWGPYDSSTGQPEQMCACRGHGSVEGVTLWGPRGAACGGFAVWGTHNEQCTPTRTVPLCACPGKGDKIGGHAIWGPAGKACGGFSGWGVYDQLCKVPR